MNNCIISKSVAKKFMYKKVVHILSYLKNQLLHHHIMGGDPNFEINIVCLYFIMLKQKTNSIFFL